MLLHHRKICLHKIILKNEIRDLQNQCMREIYVFASYVCLFGSVFIFENGERNEN